MKRIMRFADKLKSLMAELGISQAGLSGLTGIGKSSISQYLSGKNEPSEERKKQIAAALGVQEDYFRQFEAAASVQRNPVFNLPVSAAAKLMGKSKNFVEKGLQQGRFPWGYAVEMKEWSYWINSVRFSEIEGIQLLEEQPGEGGRT